MELKLTEFSPGAGCGCKISPADLREIIRRVPSKSAFENLLVGSESNDDAAVLDIGNGQALISTTDFFTPIADDPWDYGRIAAANALSDIYAMGGRPLMAISILGWPLSKLPAGMASRVIEGAVNICNEAGIPLAGGHSIDISDPVFGLSVSGIVHKENLKQNSTAQAGDRLYLSKPLGIGILSTAAKKNLLSQEDYLSSVSWMTRLNSAGIALGQLKAVHALTDVTGFGLLGHLLEVCEGSGVAAVLEFERIPVLDNVKHYIGRNCIPGGTYRNWKSYGIRIGELTEFQRFILADPQTSGGLMVAGDGNDRDLQNCLKNNGFIEIGHLVAGHGEKLIQVNYN